MKTFINDDFLLYNDTAKELYHRYAAQQPIIDYHCHLDPKMIADNHTFDTLTEIWLGGDHYKWRALRANGVDEHYITGNAGNWEKFEKWAETVPYTMRNPLYHWTHLELKTAFGIDKILNPSSAASIYADCNALLQTSDYSARGLMQKYRVETVCTTDDPIDSLVHHQAIKQSGFGIKVLPTWRPDKATAIENGANYRIYIGKLAEVCNQEINSYRDLLDALKKRHNYFAENGCRLSDHGLETFHAASYTEQEVERIFRKVCIEQKEADEQEVSCFKSAILHELAVMNWEKGWVQQFHYGALRNNNSRMFAAIGPDTGYDSIASTQAASAMSRFFDRLECNEQLTKTIIYNLNPCDNAMVATMIGNFQDGKSAGKMQWGSGWWFLDQKKGIEEQLNMLSLQGLLSRFVGMLTDSRSFLSYPRHEYFRRILCNLLGEDVEKGELPASEIDFIGKMVENICYHNAKEYFKF